MRGNDPRGGTVALVPNCVVNASRRASVLDALNAEGYGYIKFPSEKSSVEIVQPEIAYIAGDTADYIRGGYRVIAISIADLSQGGLHWEVLRNELKNVRCYSLIPKYEFATAASLDDPDMLSGLQRFLRVQKERERK